MNVVEKKLFNGSGGQFDQWSETVRASLVEGIVGNTCANYLNLGQQFRRCCFKNFRIGLNIFISNQFIQYSTVFKHKHIRIRMEAIAYQVLLLYNILTKFLFNL